MEQRSQKNLSHELLAMAQVDKDTRNGLQEGKPWDPTVDERHTRRMHEIYRKDEEARKKYGNI